MYLLAIFKYKLNFKKLMNPQQDINNSANEPINNQSTTNSNPPVELNNETTQTDQNISPLNNPAPSSIIEPQQQTTTQPSGTSATFNQTIQSNLNDNLASSSPTTVNPQNTQPIATNLSSQATDQLGQSIASISTNTPKKAKRGISSKILIVLAILIVLSAGGYSFVKFYIEKQPDYILANSLLNSAQQHTINISYAPTASQYAKVLKNNGILNLSASSIQNFSVNLGIDTQNKDLLLQENTSSGSGGQSFGIDANYQIPNKQIYVKVQNLSGLIQELITSISAISNVNSLPSSSINAIYQSLGPVINQLDNHWITIPIPVNDLETSHSASGNAISCSLTSKANAPSMADQLKSAYLAHQFLIIAGQQNIASQANLVQYNIKINIAQLKEFAKYVLAQSNDSCLFKGFINTTNLATIGSVPNFSVIINTSNDTINQLILDNNLVDLKFSYSNQTLSQPTNAMTTQQAEQILSQSQLSNGLTLSKLKLY